MGRETAEMADTAEMVEMVETAINDDVSRGRTTHTACDDGWGQGHTHSM